jgi:four helix bundle protein
LEERKMRNENTADDFTFRNLDVYRCMFDYLALEDKVVRAFPAGSAHIRDQLDRAADSMILNFSEGTGKRPRSKDRSRYYGHAVGSTTESVGGWDIARIRKHTSAETADRAIALLSRIKAMLERMRR